MPLHRLFHTSVKSLSDQFHPVHPPSVQTVPLITFYYEPNYLSI